MNPSREEMFRPGVTSPVSSMSIVIGDAVKARCSGHCPFCVSRMTNVMGVHDCMFDQHLVDWDKVMPQFKAACRYAKTVGVTNILLTGRGEPTLYKDEITRYLTELKPYEFPFVEVQTNGIAIFNGWNSSPEDCQGVGHVSESEMAMWMELGLTHIAVSIAHWDPDRNNEIYGAKRKVDLEDLFGNLCRDGFSVRACCLLMKDYVDSIDDFENVVSLCNSWGASQLRISSLGKPEKPESKAVEAWIDAHRPENADKIVDRVLEQGHYLRTLPHGAPVFDYNGLSVCVADCLPRSNSVGNGMQPIFWPSGRLTYSWEWKGAVLL